MCIDFFDLLYRHCLMKCGTIYVKRHSGYSSYESDPEVIIN